MPERDENYIKQSPEQEAHESLQQSAFNEWRRLNGSDLSGQVNLTPLEKINHYDAVFREGSMRLMTELRDPKDSAVKFVDKLELPKLKSELDALRKQGDVLALGKREKEIADSFQHAISEYPHADTCHVVEILDKKEMNCVGASVLGGRLLDEVGIKYLVGTIGNHVLLITTNSDGRVFWQDMQDGKEVSQLENEELTVEKIEGKKEDDTKITPKDIIAFAHQPKKEGMRFFVKKEYWQNQPLTVLPPELGLELQVLISTGFVLGNEGKNKEAIEVLELAMQKSPNDGDIHHGLARAYKGLGRYEEAAAACKNALNTDPTNSYLKNMLDELNVLANTKKDS